ncbi:MAG: pyridoxal 5'-phosphate synthase glutaminase subunit PdxT [Chloroflexi bacterium]|nr:pyridoxal 5'-phosphate synthase glutaminase subunit PdxT [Chloroflexota bacterium]MDA8187861.1 pyridoxal 5'-phosphate synthase glutaminase subunit PdxT [Dehalococcoidales bacterium]
MRTVGVLALQGAFVEHIAALRKLGAETREIRLPEQLEGLDALVIPGGESTTIGKLLVTFNLLKELKNLARRGVPMFGTCAGMIVLARDTTQGYDQPLIGAMDIVVQRNGFGRQVDSFELDLPIPKLGEAPFRAIFIRAPYIEKLGEQVEAIAQLPDGRVVCARQENLLVSAFHPELTEDLRLHEYFLSMVPEH